MAGYTGQLVALDTNTPTEVEAAQAQADAAQTQSQLARATLPSDIAIKQQTATGLGLENQQRSLANQAANLTLQQQLQLNAYRQHVLGQVMGESVASQTQSPTAGQAQSGAQLPATGDSGGRAEPAASQLSAAPSTPTLANLFDPRVQQVMQSIDPNDPQAAVKFDTQMKALSAEVPQAGQFVGAYSRANLNNWRAAIGAHGMSSLAANTGQGTTSPTAASPLAAVAPAGGDVTSASPLGAPASPLGAAGDKYLQGMSILDPKGTGEMLAMQGMIRYQQTGDPEVLKRYSPDLYEKLATASKAMTEAQKTALTTQMSTMGQQANAVLALASRLGNDAPEVRAAYNSAVINAAKNGWILPEVAQRELSQPIDFAQLAYTAAQSQTVSEFMKSSGQEAANEARARAANMPVQTEAVPGIVDANGNPIFYNRNAAPPGGYAGANPTGAGGAAGPPPADLQAFANKVSGFESGGSATAKNPRSTATGVGQFIGSTWLNLVKTTRPDLAAGKSDDQILAMRNDPTLSNQMTVAYAQQNGAHLAAEGVPVIGATLGAAHFLGAGDLDKVLHSAPNTPLTQVLSPAVLAANPSLKNQTAGGFMQGMANAYGTSPISIGGADAGGATGQTYLATLSPAMQSQVQAVMDGRLVLPNTGRMTPYQQQVMQNVMKVDPTFDFVNAPARAATRKDFTSGKSAQAVTAYNTAIGHLDQMDHAIDGLGNTPFDWLNKPAQWIGQHVGDPHTQAAIANFNTVKGAVTSELVKALRGTGGAEADIQYWQRQFDSADSPVALKAAVRTAAHLLGSRIDAMTEQYNTGMGTAAKFPPGLSPLAAQQLQRLQGEQPSLASAAGGPVTATGPGGQKIQWNGQAWVAMR